MSVFFLILNISSRLECEVQTCPRIAPRLVKRDFCCRVDNLASFVRLQGGREHPETCSVRMNESRMAFKGFQILKLERLFEPDENHTFENGLVWILDSPRPR